MIAFPYSLGVPEEWTPWNRGRERERRPRSTRLSYAQMKLKRKEFPDARLTQRRVVHCSAPVRTKKENDLWTIY